MVVLAVGLLSAAAAPATAPVPGEKLAFDAVRRALSSHAIDAASAAADRAEIARAAHLVRTLPSGRREHVAIALEQVASFGRRLTAPRALVLFGQLKANDDPAEARRLVERMPFNQAQLRHVERLLDAWEREKSS